MSVCERGRLLQILWTGFLTIIFLEAEGPDGKGQGEGSPWAGSNLYKCAHMLTLSVH